MYGTIALLVLVATVFGGIYGYQHTLGSQTQATPNQQVQPTPISMVQLTPTSAPAATVTVLGASQNYGDFVSPTPKSSTPACNYDVVALDPGNGDQYTPTDVWVLQEDVDFGAMTINFKLFYTTTPVLATINGKHHTNLWYYCSETVAKAGENSQYRERLSDSKIVGNPLYGMTVFSPFGQ